MTNSTASGGNVFDNTGLYFNTYAVGFKVQVYNTVIFYEYGAVTVAASIYYVVGNNLTLELSARLTHMVGPNYKLAATLVSEIAGFGAKMGTNSVYTDVTEIKTQENELKALGQDIKTAMTVAESKATTKDLKSMRTTMRGSLKTLNKVENNLAALDTSIFTNHTEAMEDLQEVVGVKTDTIAQHNDVTQEEQELTTLQQSNTLTKTQLGTHINQLAPAIILA